MGKDDLRSVKKSNEKKIWPALNKNLIFFIIFSDKLYIFGCEYNLRPDHCMYTSVCKTAEKFGVQIVHGNRGVFHKDKQPAFKAIYQAWSEVNIRFD